MPHQRFKDCEPVDLTPHLFSDRSPIFAASCWFFCLNKYERPSLRKHEKAYSFLGSYLRSAAMCCASDTQLLENAMVENMPGARSDAAEFSRRLFGRVKSQGPALVSMEYPAVRLLIRAVTRQNTHVTPILLRASLSRRVQKIRASMSLPMAICQICWSRMRGRIRSFARRQTFSRMTAIHQPGAMQCPKFP